MSKIAVVIHAFYLDIFKHMLEKLEYINVPFKLYVTTSHEKYNETLSIISSYELEYEIKSLNNHGRDVLPFLDVISNVINDGFEYVLKLHTKKTEEREDGISWNSDIYDNLLNPLIISTALDHFYNTPSLGMIGPYGYILPMEVHWPSNKKHLSNIVSKMGLEIESVMKCRFVAGTMFFVRTSSLKPLLDLTLTSSDFEKEAGQDDGTMAHAIERAFALSVLASGFVLVGTETLGVESCEQISRKSYSETLLSSLGFDK